MDRSHRRNAPSQSAPPFLLAAFLALLLTALLAWTPGASRADDGKKPLKEPGSPGTVFGHIRDAKTGAYLAGARVEILLPDYIKPVKGASGATGKEGFYKLRAPLGSITSKFDVGRFLASNIFSLLSGSAEKKDQFVSSTQFVVRVTRDGYHPFYGVVPVVSADAADFSAWAAPVFLSPLSGKAVSFAGRRDTPQGRITHVETLPSAPRPGEEVTLRFTAEQLPVRGDRKFKLFAWFEGDSWRMRLVGKVKDPWKDCALIEGKPEERAVFEVKIRRSKEMYPGLWRARIYPDTMAGCIAYGAFPVGLDTATKATVESKLQSKELTDSRTLRFSPSFAGYELDRLAASIDSRNAAAPARSAEAAAENSVVPTILALIQQGRHTEALEKTRAWKPDASLKGVRNLLEMQILAVTGDYAAAEKKAPSSLKPLLKLAAKIKKNPNRLQERAELALLTAKETGGTDPVTSASVSLLGKPVLIACWKRATENLPESASTPEERYHHARLLVVVRRSDEAEALLRQVVGDKIVGIRAGMLLGDLLYDAKRFDDAYGVYEPLFARDGVKRVGSFTARHNWGCLLLQKKETGRAAEALAAALSSARNRSEDYTKPNSFAFAGTQSFTILNGPAVRATVGYAYSEAEHDALILENLEYLNNPDKDWLRAAILGRAMASVGLFDQALPLLTQVAEKHETEPFALMSLGGAYLLAGDKRSAWKWVKKARAVDPEGPEARGLAEVLQKAADQEAAEEVAQPAATAEQQSSAATVAAATASAIAEAEAEKQRLAARKAAPALKVRSVSRKVAPLAVKTPAKPGARPPGKTTAKKRAKKSAKSPAKPSTGKQ